MSYPALPGSPDHALAAKLFGGRGGGVLSFVLSGSMAQTKTFLGVTILPVTSCSCTLHRIQAPVHCSNLHIEAVRRLAVLCSPRKGSVVANAQTCVSKASGRWCGSRI